MDPRGAERQQKQIYNYKDYWKKKNKKIYKPATTQLWSPYTYLNFLQQDLSSSPVLPNYSIHWNTQNKENSLLSSSLHAFLSTEQLEL